MRQEEKQGKAVIDLGKIRIFFSCSNVNQTSSFYLVTSPCDVHCGAPGNYFI